MSGITQGMHDLLVSLKNGGVVRRGHLSQPKKNFARALLKRGLISVYDCTGYIITDSGREYVNQQTARKEV